MSTFEYVVIFILAFMCVVSLGIFIQMAKVSNNLENWVLKSKGEQLKMLAETGRLLQEHIQREERK